MREPKDIHKYMPSLVAGIRLLDLAMQNILCRANARVKWELTLHMYYPPEALKNSKAIALPTRGTFSSGTYDDPETSKPTAGEGPIPPGLAQGDKA